MEGSVETGNPVDAGTSEGAAPVNSAPAAAAPAAQSHWIDGVSDPDTKAWAENKGLVKGDIGQVLNSYRNMEKLFGADKAGRTIELPGMDAPEEVWNGVYDRLGRPEKPDGYQLPVPEGDDGATAKWASEVFHKAGLTPRQAEMVASAYNKRVASVVSERDSKIVADAETARANLRKEWGAAYEQNIKAIDRYADRVGLDQSQIESLRDVMGGDKAALLLYKLGRSVGEHIVDEGEPTGGAMTPAQARQEMNRLMGDKQFTEAWINRNHPQHKEALEKKASLARQMTGVR